jgi:hypothetical protein
MIIDLKKIRKFKRALVCEKQRYERGYWLTFVMETCGVSLSYGMNIEYYLYDLQFQRVNEFFHDTDNIHNESRLCSSSNKTTGEETEKTRENKGVCRYRESARADSDTRVRCFSVRSSPLITRNDCAFVEK